MLFHQKLFHRMENNMFWLSFIFLEGGEKRIKGHSLYCALSYTTAVFWICHALPWKKQKMFQDPNNLYSHSNKETDTVLGSPQKVALKNVIGWCHRASQAFWSRPPPLEPTCHLYQSEIQQQEERYSLDFSVIRIFFSSNIRIYFFFSNAFHFSESDFDSSLKGFQTTWWFYQDVPVSSAQLRFASKGVTPNKY